MRPVSRRFPYWAWLVVIASGALVVIGRFLQSLSDLVDLATILSFVSTPVIAWLNHRAMVSPEVPEAARPGHAMRVASLACVGALGLGAVFYLWWRFGGGAGG